MAERRQQSSSSSSSSSSSIPLVSRHAADAAEAELAVVYDALEEHLASLGVRCQACGRCCDFLRNDYRLYASFIERAPIVRRHGPPHLTPSGHCCFLAGGRCSIHPWRPLGCRVFFCAPDHKPREPETHEAFQRRLRAATERLGLPWDYAPFFT